MTLLFSTKYFQSDLWLLIATIEFTVYNSKKKIVNSIVEIKILSMSVNQLEVSVPNSTSLLVLLSTLQHIYAYFEFFIFYLLLHLKFTHFYKFVLKIYIATNSSKQIKFMHVPG